MLPVVNYASEIAVEAAGEGSRVRWSGRFDAPAGVADAAAQEAIGGVYSGGLEAREGGVRATEGARCPCRKAGRCLDFA